MRRILITLIFFWSLVGKSQAQKSQFAQTELENFVIQTDQEAYLSGDRLWFAGKLLKNHESYRYSKLAYISLLDGDNNKVHEEKMLLTSQNMVFGDIFIPENSPSGVYTFVIYT